MKTKVHIKFDAEGIPGNASAILEPAGCRLDAADIHDYTIYDIRRVTVRLELDEGDERIAKVFSLLEQYGVKADTFEFTEFSDEDLQSARLLWMTPDVNQSLYTGHVQGTKYDLSQACANCASGAVQISPLYTSHYDIPNLRKCRAIGGFGHEIVVDGGIRKKLVDANVTGISFGEVRARLKNRKWSMVARDQILIAHTMPPRRFEPTTTEDKYLCKVCRRGGFGWVSMKLYRSEDLVGMQDFNLTWEWYGEFWPKPKDKDRHAKWPHPKVLVTPKVMNIFRDAGVTTFQWTPVSIDE